MVKYKAHWDWFFELFEGANNDGFVRVAGVMLD